MTFICPDCHKKCCTGLSYRDFVIIDEDKNLTSILRTQCNNCGTNLQIHIEAKVTEMYVIPKEALT